MNFNEYYKSNGEIRKFVANTNLPLGIKKATAVYLTKDGLFTIEFKKLPYDVLYRDKAFFVEEKVCDNKIGGFIKISNSTTLNSSKKRKHFKAKTIFEIVDINETGLLVINNSIVGIFNIVTVGKFPIKYENIYPYWYLSSTGLVKRAFVGEYERLDKARKQANNYYNTKEEAEKAYTDIMLK